MNVRVRAYGPPAGLHAPLKSLPPHGLTHHAGWVHTEWVDQWIKWMEARGEASGKRDWWLESRYGGSRARSLWPTWSAMAGANLTLLESRPHKYPTTQ